jgi:phage replication O-like protein O
MHNSARYAARPLIRNLCMASPQVEGGYTRIANEIVEALARVNVPGEVMRILLIVLRKTYGFSKKEDAISLSQFCLLSGIKKPNCTRAIKKALGMRLIIRTDNGKVPTYRFNKDFDTWRSLSNEITLSKRITNVIRGDNKSLSARIPTKEIYKEKKETPSSQTYSPEVIELSTLLAEKILSNNPKHRELCNGKFQTKVNTWADPIEKLHRIDRQTFEDVRRVIEWSQVDNFWKLNILSGASLRKNWDRLYLQMNKQQGNKDRPIASYAGPSVLDKINAAEKEMKDNAG